VRYGITQFLQKLRLNWDKNKKIQGSNWEWRNDTWHNSNTWQWQCHVTRRQLDTGKFLMFKNSKKFKNLKKKSKNLETDAYHLLILYTKDLIASNSPK